MKSVLMFNQDQELASFFQYSYQTMVLKYYFLPLVLSLPRSVIELLPISVTAVVATVAAFHVEACCLAQVF